MEIEVGEYGRTNEGEIHKIIETKKDDEYSYKYYICDNDMGYLRSQIVNHSKNIIDLIEVGDYVNGFEIDEFDDTEGNMYLGIPIYDDALMNCISEFLPIDKIEIKEILTHEQYAANCYKLEKEG